MVFNEILSTITNPNVVISFFQFHLPNITMGAVSVAMVDSSPPNSITKFPGVLCSHQIKLHCCNYDVKWDGTRQLVEGTLPVSCVAWQRGV